MKTTSVSYFASGSQVLNTQLTRKLAEEFLDSQRYSEDLRLEGNGIGEAYMYNKQPVEGYVYLDAYYLEKRGEEYATILCTEEVEGTLEEVENALLEYYLQNEGYKAQAIENRLQEEEQAYNPNMNARTIFYASYESPSFDFDALGATEEEARNTLIDTLIRHGNQFDLYEENYGGRYWFDMDNIVVTQKELGKGYRDNHLMTYENPKSVKFGTILEKDYKSLAEFYEIPIDGLSNQDAREQVANFFEEAGSFIDYAPNGDIRYRVI